MAQASPILDKMAASLLRDLTETGYRFPPPLRWLLEVRARHLQERDEQPLELRFPRDRSQMSPRYPNLANSRPASRSPHAHVAGPYPRYEFAAESSSNGSLLTRRDQSSNSASGEG